MKPRQIEYWSESGEIDQGIFDPANYGKDRSIIFQNAWEIYMKQSPCGKVRTDDRERVFNVNLMPYWKDKSLSEIEEHHIKDWFSKLPSHYSPASLKKILNVLRAFLNYFQITRRKVFRYPEVKIPKKAVLWLSQEDQDRVFEFIPIQHQGILQFIRTYGCRSSEVCHLKKADIDWSKRTIIFRERKIPIENELPITEEIEKYLVGGGVSASGKSQQVKSLSSVAAKPSLSCGIEESREPLIGQPSSRTSDKSHAMLEQGGESCPPTKVSNLLYVFCTSKGQPYTHQFLYNIWHAANLKAHEKYGVKILPLKNATRHSLASRLLNQDQSLETIAFILGNSRQVVENYYGRIRTQKVMGILEGK